jgi:general secretion pathway protein J
MRLLLTNRPRGGCGRDGTRRLQHGLRRAAFTLVEMMIAIGLLSLVVAAIYSSWSAILRGTRVGLDAAAAGQRSRLAVRMLEDSLASAQAFAAHMQQHPEYYSFVGDENSLTFVARLSQSFPRSGKFGDFDVRRLYFELESNPEGGRQLVLRQSTLLMEMDQDEKDHPLVLAKNVDKFQLQFWDKKKNEWVDSWTDNFTNQLPPLVQVLLSVKTHPHDIKPAEEILRVVSVPATTVAPTWQTVRAPTVPGQPGAPGGPGGPPGPGGANQGLPPAGFVNPR